MMLSSPTGRLGAVFRKYRNLFDRVVKFNVLSLKCLKSLISIYFFLYLQSDFLRICKSHPNFPISQINHVVTLLPAKFYKIDKILSY